MRRSVSLATAGFCSVALKILQFGLVMKRRNRPPEQDAFLRPHLIDLINMRHELVKLAALIDWEFLDQEWPGSSRLEPGDQRHRRDWLRG